MVAQHDAVPLQLHEAREHRRVGVVLAQGLEAEQFLEGLREASLRAIGEAGEPHLVDHDDQEVAGRRRGVGASRRERLRCEEDEDA